MGRSKHSRRFAAAFLFLSLPSSDLQPFRKLSGKPRACRSGAATPRHLSQQSLHQHASPGLLHRESADDYRYTRKLGLPAVRGGLGHGGNEHVDDEYIVIEGTAKVAGIVQVEQSIVDLLFTYAVA